MDKIIYFAALIMNIIQICLAVYLVLEGYGTEALLASFLIVPPVLSMLAIHFSPDFEERRLTRRLRKAQLRQQLAELEKSE